MIMRTAAVNSFLAGIFTFTTATHAQALAHGSQASEPTQQSSGTLELILIAGGIAAVSSILVAIISVVGPPLVNRRMAHTDPVKETQAASNDALLALTIERQQDVEILRKQLEDAGLDPEA